MKPAPNVGPAPAASQEEGIGSILRFWACFIFCLVALGIIAGLMLTVFFLIMGYRMF